MGKQIRLTTYTSADLAKIYGISVQTVRRWVKPLEPLIGERMGHYFTPKQMGYIREELDKRFTANVKVAEEVLEKRRIRLRIPDTVPRQKTIK